MASKDQPVDELRRFVVQEIAHMVANGMKTGAFMDWTVANAIADKYDAHIQAECNRARLQELYDWKNNSPAGRDMYVDKRIKKLQQLMKGEE